MQSEFPVICEETLRVQKSELNCMAGSCYAAIDRGSTLTKILHTTEAVEDQCELHFAMFSNKHFVSALQYLREQLHRHDSAPLLGANIRVTGVGANLDTEKVKDVLGVEPEFIDEWQCQMAGFRFLLRHFPLENICHPEVELNDPNLDAIQHGETFRRIRESKIAMMKEQAAGERFPCLFALCGSGAWVALLKEDGSAEILHRHLLAGKSFLGMCQLLLGTCDYQRIMELAAAGKRGNIDTQVREILADSPNSPYGRMPATLPFFPFGKAVDFDKSLEDCRPEDIAHSLVSSFTVNFVNKVVFLAGYERIRNIYFGGGFFQHEVVRKEIARFSKIFGTAETVSFNFLKTTHTAALGAAIGYGQDSAGDRSGETASLQE